MEIGINLPVMVPGLDRDLVTQWCQRVDAGPFSTFAVGERICFPNPEAMVTMSFAAAITHRVRLAFGVLVLPMHKTVHLAKQLATLDVLCDGRLSVGVGVGAREEDFVAMEADFDDYRLGTLERQVELLRKTWNGGHVVKGALRPVEPFPLQHSGPELMSGSLLPQSIRRAAAWADGISGFSFGPNGREIEACFETARQAWRERGRIESPRLVTNFWFALGAKAREQLDSYLGLYLNFMGGGAAEVLAPTVKTDSAQALKDSIAMVEDLGADELLLVPTTSDPSEVDRIADIIG